MATSKSTSESDWTAGAFIFSGRPDPTWPIPSDVAGDLVVIWESLPPSEATVSPPTLGYRGCYVRCSTGRMWTAYRELVTHSDERRRDDERCFERTVLSSAPAGLLPESTAEG
jgi:hypothetical protein